MQRTNSHLIEPGLNRSFARANLFGKRTISARQVSSEAEKKEGLVVCFSCGRSGWWWRCESHSGVALGSSVAATGRLE